MLGVVLALCEVLIFFGVAKWIRNSSHNLQKMNGLTYYWFTFMVLTGFWECIFISKYETSVNISQNLVNTSEHVWTNDYSVANILPWSFGLLFYGEYGAWADREYMSTRDVWSRLIEGSHMWFCGFLCLASLVTAVRHTINSKNYFMIFSFAMGCQFMNSFLYMGEYSIQCKNKHSVNYYNTNGFPAGKFLIDRPFMWVNYLWTFLPGIITIIHLVQNQYLITTDTPQTPDTTLPKYSEKSEDDDKLVSYYPEHNTGNTDEMIPLININ